MTRDEAVGLLRKGDLLELGREADRVRRSLHDGDAVTYALTAPAGLGVRDAVRSAVVHQGTHVCLAAVAEAGALSPALLAEALAMRAPPHTILFADLPVSALQGRTADSLAAYHHAGVRSVLLPLRAGDGPRTAALHDLLDAAHALDISIRVAMTMHASHSPEERVDTLLAVQALRPQSVHALELLVEHASGPAARREDEATAADYLKTLALARLLLPQVPHLQAAWDVQGPKVLELALRFGADDAGSVAWTQAGRSEPSHHGGESELRRIIRDAGFRPVERDALFRASLLH